MAIEEAWVNFTPAATPTVNAGKNIASVSQNATGDYSVNLKDDLASATVAGVPDTLGILPFATVGGVTAAQANPLHIKCQVVSRREIRIRTRDLSSVLTDAAEISMKVRADLTPVGE